MKAIISASFILFALGSCYARLGETLNESVARYGSGEKQSDEYGEIFLFNKNGLEIKARFIDGKCGWILYKSPSRIFPNVIDGLLESESSGAKWEVDEIGTQSSLDSGVFRDSKLFKREDGQAKATYQEVGAYNGLLIISAAYSRSTAKELEGL